MANLAVALVHRAAHRLAGAIEAGAAPFEVAVRVAVDVRLDEPARRNHDSGRLGRVLVRRDDRPAEPLGRRDPEVAEDLLDVAAEERVELRRVLGGEVVAVPPVPVAPLGDEEVTARRFELVPRQLALLFRLRERLARLAEQCPGGVVLRVPDPDAEVRIDPAPGVDARDARARRTLAQLVARKHGADLSAREAGVERIEERLPGGGIMLPRVLSIERQRDERFGLGVGDARDEILGRLARIALRVAEADAVGQLAIAEEDGHGVIGPGAVGVVVRRVAVGQRGAELQLTALEHSLIGRAPAHAAGGEEVDDFRRHRAFRGPHSLRDLAERRPRPLEAAHHLLARVMRIREARRQRHRRHRAPGRLGVHDQRQDGVVEGRAGDLHLPALGQGAPARHDPRRDPPLRVHRRDLLLLGVASLLGDQPGDERLFPAGGESHPGEHEVDLEVAHLLWRECRLPLEEVDLPQVGAPLVEQLGIARHRPHPNVPVD